MSMKRATSLTSAFVPSLAECSETVRVQWSWSGLQEYEWHARIGST